MRSTLSTALWALTAVVSCLFVWAGHGWWNAHTRLAQLREHDRATADLVQEVRHLRTLPVIVADEPTRQESVFGMVSDTLVHAGINPSSLKDVGSDAVGGTAQNYRRQKIRIQLDSVSVPDVGRFLASWRKHHPTWIATAFNLAPMQRADSTLDQPAWSVSIEVTSTFLDRAPDAAANRPAPHPSNLMPARPAR